MRAVLLVFLLLSGPAAPDLDLVEPGARKVRNEVVLAWPESVGDMVFVAFPTRGFSVPLRIEAGVPFVCSHKYGTRIYAVPAGLALPEGREAWLDGPWPSAAPPVRFRWSVPASNPLAVIRTDVRVVGVRADGLDLERGEELHLDAHGHELGGLRWLPLVLLAAVGAVWLVRLDRHNVPRYARRQGKP